MNTIGPLAGERSVGRTLRVGIIGLGAIGTQVLSTLHAHRSLGIEVTGILARSESSDGVRQRSQGVPVFTAVGDLLMSAPDIVAECAGAAALAQYGDTVLRGGADLLVSSVGALADDALATRLDRAASERERRILLPAGAIGGLDILGAAHLAGLHVVRYRGRKPPAAWRGSLAEAVIDLQVLREPAVLFEGSAREAAIGYPKNANVAATVALATLGLDAVRVQLIADPTVRANVHEIEADGVTGTIFIRVEGIATTTNARTSAITGFSVAWSILKQRLSPATA